ncbi:MAG: alpha-ketoglutarate-dependent dioxygenase AlkB [Alphaproteobacteria bacterium]|nr:alpha-ketoglutarate-dependent dioxygenase AlkB [Alphaproteobacteria bacterium]
MRQVELFPATKATPEPSIPGLSLTSGYISADEEQALLSAIDGQLWLTDLKRRVQHYGYRYDYKARAITKELYLGPLPEWLQPLCGKLHADKIFAQKPDQVIVNEYLPGQGISSHVDCVPCFGDTIASLSLGSACIMELSNPKTEDKREVLLEPQSLITLTGLARYEWLHGIPARKSDVIHGLRRMRERRVSLTFRKVIL